MHGKVAVVAGASRGCGRGIALALGETGATVYVTGRTRRSGPRPADGAPGTIDDTADEVTRRGGQGIAVGVDHTRPDEVQSLFRRVAEEQGRLDVVACAVWGGNERYNDPIWERPFWEQPAGVWDECLGAGPYAFWLASHAAAPHMKDSGLILAISEPILENAFEDQIPAFAETFWGLAHYAINRLVRSLAADARKSGIAVVGLLPGFMRTERVEMHLRDEEARKQARYDLTESPEYTGRAVAALMADPDVLSKSGQLLYVADLAEQFGFTDIDGKRTANFYRELGLI